MRMSQNTLLPQVSTADPVSVKPKNSMQAWSIKHQMLLKINGFNWLWSEHSTRIHLSIKNNLGMMPSSPSPATVSFTTQIYEKRLNFDDYAPPSARNVSSSNSRPPLMSSNSYQDLYRPLSSKLNPRRTQNLDAERRLEEVMNWKQNLHT